MPTDLPTEAFYLSNAILAIGSLGTAAFALVDATKALGGGISGYGFGHIEDALHDLFPANVNKADKSNPLTFGSIKDTLYANWLNGMALADQQSIAKTLIKLRLDAANAAHLAEKTGVSPAVLGAIATKYTDGTPLLPTEQNVAGRFDLLLSTVLGEGYQRADQAYRNGAKFLTVVFAVLLALAGNWALGASGGAGVQWSVAFIAGLLAAPLAPISKDLASALQASVKAMQVLRK
jgi:hypothetical protein